MPSELQRSSQISRDLQISGIISFNISIDTTMSLLFKFVDFTFWAHSVFLLEKIFYTHPLSIIHFMWTETVVVWIVSFFCLLPSWHPHYCYYAYRYESIEKCLLYHSRSFIFNVSSKSFKIILGDPQRSCQNPEDLKFCTNNFFKYFYRYYNVSTIQIRWFHIFISYRLLIIKLFLYAPTLEHM